jgi:hypothetical protein
MRGAGLHGADERRRCAAQACAAAAGSTAGEFVAAATHRTGKFVRRPTRAESPVHTVQAALPLSSRCSQATSETQTAKLFDNKMRGAGAVAMGSNAGACIAAACIGLANSAQSPVGRVACRHGTLLLLDKQCSRTMIDTQTAKRFKREMHGAGVVICNLH